MPEATPHVYIIDDDDAVRTGLARLMRSAKFHVDTFSSAEDYLNRANIDGPACLILDVRMDGLSGLELQERLTRGRLSCPIIFLTGHGDIPMSVQAMKEGAFDFFTKPVDDGQLLEAVANALETHARILSETACPFRALLKNLTAREFEVMRCVISGALNKQIAAHLDITEKTVKVHRGRVMHKLGIESVAELVRHSIEAGVEPTEL
jgi:FixJ family two-component response regulator